MYTLLVTGDVPGASTYFNPLLKQTVIPCTSGTQPTSPPTGMVIYETDTGYLRKYTGSAWETLAGSRFSFTPTLTASTTNPTLGTGSQRLGWWSIVPGPAVVYSFFISFGTSPNPGSGSYSISLPTPSASPFGAGHCAVGACQLADNSSGAFQPTTIFVPNGSSTAAFVGTAPVTSSSPWTWAASDYISGTVTYPV